MAPDRLAELAGCAAVFLPEDPPRLGRVAFCHTDASASPASWPGANGRLTVVRPHGSSVRRREVPATIVPLPQALAPLVHARRVPGADPAAAFWGAAAVLALQLLARGRLLPGVSPQGFDAWRIGPYDPDDARRVRELAAAMPPEARAIPLPGVTPLQLPAAEPLLRAFLDAIADTLPRTPAAQLAVGGAPWAARAPQHVPEQRAWADQVAAGLDTGVRVSLRLELPTPADFGDDEWDWDDTDDLGVPDGPDARAAGDDPWDGGTRDGLFRAVVQLHSLGEATLVTDAADIWTGRSPAASVFGPRAKIDTLLALRRAARSWPPLGRLLTAAAPTGLDLSDTEVQDLLGQAATDLAAAGIQVHWPKELARDLLAHAVIEPAERAASDLPSLLDTDTLLTFRWQLTIGGHQLTPTELDRLAETQRPLVRLRDQWVVIDPEALRRARERQARTLTPVEALAAVLAGSTQADGERVEVTAGGWLAKLKERLADPEATARRTPLEPPAALRATLRDYQLRGLTWLNQMTSLGLGACLADDMGLGKTITLIALHLHRQTTPATAGPTLVICPTSLLGNWQREIERFAPNTPVRRFHGPTRTLDDLAPDEVVLTTYATMRLDTEHLTHTGAGAGAGTHTATSTSTGAGAGGGAWGLLVADEAQHVKNPYSATARALRTIPTRAKVALTGTPVENNLSELWALLDWTTPGLLGPLKSFRDSYARGAESGQDPDAADRLARTVRPFLLRRRKSDPGIAPELPPKTETDRAVALTKEQIALYEAVVRETMAAIAQNTGIARRGLVVKLLTALKQICNHPAQYLRESGGKIAGRSGKLELLDELLDTILAEDASVLVFTQYVAMARLIEAHLAARGVPVQFLHGATPVKQREEMVQRFQDGHVPVFLLSLKAAGTGLNLTRAGHVIHFDRWWNPAVEDQATDRAYRIGQTQPVQVHRMITEGTVEDRIADMLKRKKALADAVLSGGEAAFTELSDAELADLVHLRVSTR
ncbi:DEAD/DEAH box helicase [Kitasatospora sp. NPDC085895]|uniref:DEAD/DEAH box helicase n=1 Tax=Kitasatospora sp. NPDC085895 TaxID=3155057 RepID=UPI00344B459E